MEKHDVKPILTQLDDIVSATSIEALWTLHTAYMADFGFDRLLYGFTRYSTVTSRGKAQTNTCDISFGDPQDWVLLTTHSNAYMTPYLNDGHAINGPMMGWALENQGICSWRWIEDKLRAGKFNPRELDVIAFNRKMKVTAGYTISFESVSERVKAAIALTAKIGMSQDDVEEVWQAHGEKIVIANNVMHLKLLTLPHTGKRHLTKRQLEVLQWVGDGKTAQDTAVLLGLTPATVEKHLRLAREALDVETTAQAVLKAAFFNQMFVIDI